MIFSDISKWLTCFITAMYHVSSVESQNYISSVFDILPNQTVTSGEMTGVLTVKDDIRCYSECNTRDECQAVVLQPTNDGQSVVCQMYNGTGFEVQSSQDSVQQTTAVKRKIIAWKSCGMRLSESKLHNLYDYFFYYGENNVFDSVAKLNKNVN